MWVQSKTFNETWPTRFEVITSGYCVKNFQIRSTGSLRVGALSKEVVDSFRWRAERLNREVVASSR